MFKEDGNVLHFGAPQGESAVHCHTRFASLSISVCLSRTLPNREYGSCARCLRSMQAEVECLRRSYSEPHPSASLPDLLFLASPSIHTPASLSRQLLLTLSPRRPRLQHPRRYRPWPNQGAHRTRPRYPQPTRPRLPRQPPPPCRVLPIPHRPSSCRRRRCRWSRCFREEGGRGRRRRRDPGFGRGLRGGRQQEEGR